MKLEVYETPQLNDLGQQAMAGRDLIVKDGQVLIEGIDQEIPDEWLDTQWRWRVTAGNGEIVAGSSEGFDSRFNAERNYELFMTHARDAWVEYWRTTHKDRTDNPHATQ